MSEIAVSIDKLSKDFGRIIALHEVSFDVKAGEFITILGRNGAGKTTLLNIISGTARPTSGKVLLFGSDPRITDNKRRLAVISHEVFLYPNLTALENLQYYASMYGLSHADDRCLQVLSEVGLSLRRFDLAGTFSRGMLQRLTIARAILHNPAVLLLDEPFTGLDQHAIRMLVALLEKQKQEKRTIILTTHDLHVGLELADRYLILEKHELKDQGYVKGLSIENLRDKYFNNIKAGETV